MTFQQWWNDQENGAPSKVFDTDEQMAEAALNAASAELAECKRDAEWQPIDTAPKDGTTVILGRDMGDFGFVRGYGNFDGKEGSFVSGWISHGFSRVHGNLGLAHPTHWMPLPKPPAMGATE